MHSLFRCADVVGEIVIYLGPLIDPNENISTRYNPSAGSMQQTLLNVALTCWAFKQPALNALWWEMYSLEPLLSLIPSIGDSKPPSFFLHGKLSQSDFQLFEDYANRICYLHRSDGDDIPTTLFAQVMQIRQFAPLLPNLRYLKHGATPELAFFLGPNLCFLRLSEIDNEDSDADSEDEDPGGQGWIAPICFCAPNVQTLVLHTGTEVDFSSTLCQITTLTRLEVHKSSFLIDQDLDKICSSLSRLSHLLLKSVEVSDGYQTPTVSSLPSLSTLTITSTNIEQVGHLFHAISFPQLETLNLCIENDDSDFTLGDELQWKLFFTRLGIRTSRKLKCLLVRLPPDQYPVDTEEWTIPGVQLESLPGIEELDLTHFTLDIPVINCLSNRSVDTLVQAWPRLRSLGLTTFVSASIKFDALARLAQGLPGLEDLQLGIDTEEPPPLNQIPILSHRLRRLAINNCKISTPGEFCVYLDRIFPFVKLLPGGLDDSLFKQLASQLSWLRSVRGDERARIKAKTTAGKKFHPRK